MSSSLVFHNVDAEASSSCSAAASPERRWPARGRTLHQTYRAAASPESPGHTLNGAACKQHHIAACSHSSMTSPSVHLLPDIALDDPGPCQWSVEAPLHDAAGGAWQTTPTVIFLSPPLPSARSFSILQSWSTVRFIIRETPHVCAASPYITQNLEQSTELLDKFQILSLVNAGLIRRDYASSIFRAVVQQSITVRQHLGGKN